MDLGDRVENQHASSAACFTPRMGRVQIISFSKTHASIRKLRTILKFCKGTKCFLVTKSSSIYVEHKPASQADLYPGTRVLRHCGPRAAVSDVGFGQSEVAANVIQL